MRYCIKAHAHVRFFSKKRLIILTIEQRLLRKAKTLYNVRVYASIELRVQTALWVEAVFDNRIDKNIDIISVEINTSVIYIHLKSTFFSFVRDFIEEWLAETYNRAVSDHFLLSMTLDP